MQSLRPDAVAHLTGMLYNVARPNGIVLPGTAGKFWSDGTVQTWPGNTFICHLDSASDAFAAIREMQETAKRSEFNRFFTFLPPSSFHMTILQGVTAACRQGDGWPQDVSAGATRDTISAELLKRTADLRLPSSFRVRFIDLFAGSSLTIAGADDGEEKKLRSVRKAIRDAARIPQAGFDEYVFHISYAYQLEFVSETLASEITAFSMELSNRFRDRLGEIELGPVEFCHFETMHHYTPIRLFR
ncbi:RNA ligase family protein (plasmid) [Rhizobium etli 8C-3]|uniref:RNA ligase family protein n=1 Tax=Rhizobium etli 8C-3 TaxID=538025 RepID=A0A1L5PAW3_RHIET|nr:DUF1868 domain-containing protein [Rhizobium etli]APO77206.1 RNA ligase family protein [Rhizobium etli 8C-3]